MKALILNGAVASRDMADAAEAALSPELSARGYQIARHDLTALDVPDCKGDFGCWTVTPGICVQPGPHRDVVRDIVRSDLVVSLTPITFGGYSSALKRQLDHCIPLISPWFTKVDGETHHLPRYERFPAWLTVGLLELAQPAAAAVFERLVRRNVLNIHAPKFASPCLTREELPRLPLLAARWLDDLESSERPRAAAEPLDLSARPGLPVAPAKRALLLVGSPRGGVSVSGAIAAHLGALLKDRGLLVTTERIQGCLREDAELHRLAAAFWDADVVALATPLYVDSLPGPVTRALEVLAERRAALGPPRPRFLAIVNSGFPEAVHNDTALAICRLFAAAAALDWVGGLAIGGGGMLAGKPLAQGGGRAARVVRALASTADAIAAGLPIPPQAQRVEVPLPAWLYRFLADLTFRQEGRKRGTLSRMGARPYARAGIHSG
jgi:NAD(P)H-dependent FMN reductase